MEYYGKEKRPYRGIWIAFINMIIFPIMIYGLFYWAMTSKTTLPHDEIVYMCLGFAGLVGLIYSIICILVGMIGDLFEAMITRIRETIQFYGFFTKRGCKYYWYNFIHDGGSIMWGFFLFMFANIGVSAFGFVNYFILLAAK